MTLMYRIIYAAHCSGTHHKIAMDALCHLKSEYSERWKALFLGNAAKYVEGAKAPDNEFRDFSNHVLHVDDEFWGGADNKAYVWYEKLVNSLKVKDWEQAAYDAGVLSHYYTDPIQPLHTAQSEAENNIHRAFEWSISKSYNELKALGEKEFPTITVSHDYEYDWLERLVRKGAVKARVHYEMLVSEYDFKKGAKNPPAGLNEKSKRVLSELIRYATVGFAGILDRAFNEAKVIPPHADLNMKAFLLSLKVPIRWIANKLEDRAEKRLVLKMYEEYITTGKVEKYLPEDDKLVRDLYIEEVLEPKRPGSLAEALKNLKSIAKQMRDVDNVSVAREKSGQEADHDKIRQNARTQVTLKYSDPVEKAPSIGKKTASRLAHIGITTVEHLMQADCVEVSEKLEVRYITPQQVNDWQDQAGLVCQVPRLWGHDAQLLVAVECRTAKALRNAKPEDLLSRLEKYIQTSQGKRILRSSKAPDITEVLGWIAAAQSVESKAEAAA